MKRAILLLAASLACLARSGAAQLPPDNTTAPVAVSDPTKLFQRLMPPRSRDEDCESTAKEQAAVLRELGIPATSAQEARLVFEDLDGDGVPEALFTVDIDLANVVLVVLKRKGNQWYRLPSPPGFSCWCKYENSSLVDTFVEIQHWSYDFEKPRQPRRLVFVRGSGGGTGLYERDLQVFALRGFELSEVFGTREDRRDADRFRPPLWW